MQLIPIPHTHIDAAWNAGASCLARACDTSGGEITGDQLKMLLARGERTLLRMDAPVDVTYTFLGGGAPEKQEMRPVGWGVVRIDQLPNMRVLFVTDLVAPGGHFERFFVALRNLAATHGCSRIRCAAKPAQARLYSMKCGFRPVYTIQEVEV